MAALDSPRGGNNYFESFLVTAIGDLPEVDVQSATGVTTAILANQKGGVVEIPVGASDDDDVAAISTNLNWQVEPGGLWGEARLKVDTSIADMKYFIGFGDSIASSDETSFSATTDTVTIDTMTDGIGFLWDGDATTLNHWCVAGKADAVTVGQVLTGNKHDFALNTYKTFRVWIAQDGLSAEWSIDGELVHHVESTTTLITPTASLAFGVWNYEQGTAYELEVDYIEAHDAMDSGDN